MLLLSGQFGGSSAVSLANISSMYLVQCFQGSYSLRSAFGLCLNFPQPSPPFNFSLINHCDRCLVPLVWGLMAGRREFTSHEAGHLILRDGAISHN